MGGDADNAADVVAKKLGQIFIIINIIDGVFFVYSMLSLRINIGDTIH